MTVNKKAFPLRGIPNKDGIYYYSNPFDENLCFQGLWQRSKGEKRKSRPQVSNFFIGTADPSRLLEQHLNKYRLYLRILDQQFKSPSRKRMPAYHCGIDLIPYSWVPIPGHIDNSEKKFLSKLCSNATKLLWSNPDNTINNPSKSSKASLRAIQKSNHSSAAYPSRGYWNGTCGICHESTSSLSSQSQKQRKSDKSSSNQSIRYLFGDSRVETPKSLLNEFNNKQTASLPINRSNAYTHQDSSAQSVYTATSSLQRSFEIDAAYQEGKWTRQSPLATSQQTYESDTSDILAFLNNNNNCKAVSTSPTITPTPQSTHSSYLAKPKVPTTLPQCTENSRIPTSTATSPSLSWGLASEGNISNNWSRFGSNENVEVNSVHQLHTTASTTPPWMHKSHTVPNIGPSASIWQSTPPPTARAHSTWTPPDASSNQTHGVPILGNGAMMNNSNMSLPVADQPSGGPAQMGVLRGETWFMPHIGTGSVDHHGSLHHHESSSERGFNGVSVNDWTASIRSRPYIHSRPALSRPLATVPPPPTPQPPAQPAISVPPCHAPAYPAYGLNDMMSSAVWQAPRLGSSCLQYPLVPHDVGAINEISSRDHGMYPESLGVSSHVELQTTKSNP